MGAVAVGGLSDVRKASLGVGPVLAPEGAQVHFVGRDMRLGPQTRLCDLQGPLSAARAEAAVSGPGAAVTSDHKLGRLKQRN